MFKEFKSSMKKEFEMTDMGCMRYFLGVEVTQTSHGIFICQKKYANEVLEMFGLQNCPSVNNSIVPGCKLKKDVGGLKVDATTYKQIVESLYVFDCHYAGSDVCCESGGSFHGSSNDYASTNCEKDYALLKRNH